MYCPQCMKKIPNNSFTCPMCGQVTHTPIAGMATFRVSCRPHIPVWAMIVQPLTFFAGYKVHISIDDQNYVLPSKKKQIDIPVSVGTHRVRIAAIGKKGARALEIFGKAAVFTGAVTGSSATIITGAAFEDVGRAISDNGVAITFNANELKTFSVKAAWNGAIVEDKTL